MHKLYLSVAIGLVMVVSRTICAQSTKLSLPWIEDTTTTYSIDGSYSEWGTLTNPISMCTGSSVKEEGSCPSAATHLANAYLRYNSDNKMMYALVLKTDAVSNPDIQNPQITIGTTDVIKDKAFIESGGEKIGFEASFEWNETKCSIAEISLEIKNGKTASTGPNPPHKRTFCSSPTPSTPSMECGDLTSQNGGAMGLIEKFEWDAGQYNSVEGPGKIIIDNSSDETTVKWALDTGISTIFDVHAVIIRTDTNTDYLYRYEPGAKISDTSPNPSFLDPPVSTPLPPFNITSIQFCGDSVLDTKKEVCLWSADKDADGHYINIKQERCFTAKKDKFYAIKVDDNFSSVLQTD